MQTLSKSQINEIFGITGKGINKDKLIKAWKNAGSPTDSEAIMNLLSELGVPDNIIDNALKNSVTPPFISGHDDLDKAAHKIFVEKGKEAFLAWWDQKLNDLESSIGGEPETTPAELSPEEKTQQQKLILQRVQDNLAKKNTNAVYQILKGMSNQVFDDRMKKALIRTVNSSDKLSAEQKSQITIDWLSKLDRSIKESNNYLRTFTKDEFIAISKILKENHITWRTLGYGKLFQEKNKITLLEYASGGSTSAGNIASIPNAGGAMMPVIKRMPAGQSFFGPAMGAVKKPKKKAKNK